MTGARCPGLRIVVPPNAATGPTRVTCRLLRPGRVSRPPQLNDGEGLACRILEFGCSCRSFASPVLLEVPHMAALRNSEREIVVYRSDTGETWKEHALEASEQAVLDVIGGFFGSPLESNEELRQRRIVRILTASLPQYFALVTRLRQEAALIGPEGGVIGASLANGRVQSVFPDGALTKKIRVGVQVFPIPSEAAARLFGGAGQRRIAASPVVTIEPRRRKFHKPITLTLPLPSAASASGLGASQTLRLLCSITGGAQPATWEDITGSTALSHVKDSVSFTTTVSARFWLVDCQNPAEAAEMAGKLYREAAAVPYMGRFVVYAKRTHPDEARLRCLCITDDRADKTLETAQGFERKAESREVEILDGRPLWIEGLDNLTAFHVAAEPRGLFDHQQQHQLQQPPFFTVRAFRENRLTCGARPRDADQPAAGRVAFLAEPQTTSATTAAICTLELALPDYSGPPISKAARPAPRAASDVAAPAESADEPELVAAVDPTHGVARSYTADEEAAARRAKTEAYLELVRTLEEQTPEPKPLATTSEFEDKESVDEAVVEPSKAPGSPEKRAKEGLNAVEELLARLDARPDQSMAPEAGTPEEVVDVPKSISQVQAQVHTPPETAAGVPIEEKLEKRDAIQDQSMAPEAVTPEEVVEVPKTVTQAQALPKATADVEETLHKLDVHQDQSMAPEAGTPEEDSRSQRSAASEAREDSGTWATPDSQRPRLRRRRERTDSSADRSTTASSAVSADFTDITTGASEDTLLGADDPSSSDEAWREALMEAASASASGTATVTSSSTPDELSRPRATDSETQRDAQRRQAQPPTQLPVASAIEEASDRAADVVPAPAESPGDATRRHSLNSLMLRSMEFEESLRSEMRHVSIDDALNAPDATPQVEEKSISELTRSISGADTGSEAPTPVEETPSAVISFQQAADAEVADASEDVFLESASSASYTSASATEGEEEDDEETPSAGKPAFFRPEELPIGRGLFHEGGIRPEELVSPAKEDLTSAQQAGAAAFSRLVSAEYAYSRIEEKLDSPVQSPVDAYKKFPGAGGNSAAAGAVAASPLAERMTQITEEESIELKAKTKEVQTPAQDEQTTHEKEKASEPTVPTEQDRLDQKTVLDERIQHEKATVQTVAAAAANIAASPASPGSAPPSPTPESFDSVIRRSLPPDAKVQMATASATTSQSLEADEEDEKTSKIAEEDKGNDKASFSPDDRSPIKEEEDQFEMEAEAAEMMESAAASELPLNTSSFSQDASRSSEMPSSGISVTGGGGAAGSGEGAGMGTSATSEHFGSAACQDDSGFILVSAAEAGADTCDSDTEQARQPAGRDEDATDISMSLASEAASTLAGPDTVQNSECDEAEFPGEGGDGEDDVDETAEPLDTPDALGPAIGALRATTVQLPSLPAREENKTDNDTSESFEEITVPTILEPTGEDGAEVAESEVESVAAQLVLSALASAYDALELSGSAEQPEVESMPLDTPELEQRALAAEMLAERHLMELGGDLLEGGEVEEEDSEVEKPDQEPVVIDESVLSPIIELKETPESSPEQQQDQNQDQPSASTVTVTAASQKSTVQQSVRTSQIPRPTGTAPKIIGFEIEEEMSVEISEASSLSSQSTVVLRHHQQQQDRFPELMAESCSSDATTAQDQLLSELSASRDSLEDYELFERLEQEIAQQISSTGSLKKSSSSGEAAASGGGRSVSSSLTIKMSETMEDEAAAAASADESQQLFHMEESHQSDGSESATSEVSEQSDASQTTGEQQKRQSQGKRCGAAFGWKSAAEADLASSISMDDDYAVEVDPREHDHIFDREGLRLPDREGHGGADDEHGDNSSASLVMRLEQRTRYYVNPRRPEQRLVIDKQRLVSVWQEGAQPPAVIQTDMDKQAAEFMAESHDKPDQRFD
uniref:ZU5 domain-containing protein n=1 Tax=Macrostomum lignano TaxID=282301 RepID=A0A1I8I218_9PLAT